VTEPAVVRPLVHVVVVDYEGRELTLECLRSLRASDWPADRLHVVLVDNASPHPVTAQIADELPGVEIVRCVENLGFAGGANAGLRRRGDADFVAIVNNDVTVDPGWLPPLVDTLADAERIGAACPKILLTGRFAEFAVTAPTRRRGLWDRRAVGVRMSGARVDDVDVWERTQLVEGFWGPEPMDASEAGAQWTADRALVRVPVADDASSVELLLAADTDVTVTVRSGPLTTTLRVGRAPAWHPIDIGAEPVPVINNVGTVIAADGYASDRGWLEVDGGQLDQPADVDAWCGAAVLLTRAYLDDVGLFDDRLFLYYEDVELSLRGRRHGWVTRTAPASIVHHVHAASSTEGSALKDHFNERNRLLVLTRAAGAARTARAIVRYILVTLSYVRRDVLARWARGEHARPEIVRRRLRALAAYASAVPAFVAARPPRR
jgi:hypothetical protein